jgi:hypothetical protein
MRLPPVSLQAKYLGADGHPTPRAQCQSHVPGIDGEHHRGIGKGGKGHRWGLGLDSDFRVPPQLTPGQAGTRHVRACEENADRAAVYANMWECRSCSD